MWTKTIYLEFVAIYILSLVPWPNPNVIKLLCSKDNARLVRKLIQLKWTPILDKYHVKLPIECPLHPFRDIFGPQQDAKKRERPSQWTCRLCGKSFFEEKFIDKHFENRHRDIINKAEDAICFADFCDIMRCEVFSSQDLNFIHDDLYGATDIEVWSNHHHQSSPHISSSSLAQTNLRNLLQIRKRNILSIATAIAGTSAQSISGINFHTHQFCKDQKDESSKNTDEEVVSEKNQNNGKSSKNQSQGGLSDSNSSKQYDEHTMNMQKMRYNCKPDELEKLKSKCELLIRTCIKGLLLEMSEYTFKNMEEELNKATCWYLTCDRYWEDGPLEPKAFPWGLILILVMILSFGICFCYYIIWILFDSDQTISNNASHIDRYSPKTTSSSSTGIGGEGTVGTRYRQRRVYQRNAKIDNTIVGGGGGGVSSNAGGIIGGLDGNQDIIKEEKYPDDVLMQSSDGSSDLTQSDHYIYVTYPPDLKRRLLEKYE